MSFLRKLGLVVAGLASATLFGLALRHDLSKPRTHYVYVSAPPNEYELYCMGMQALNRSQPPHQQFYGVGCPKF